MRLPILTYHNLDTVGSPVSVSPAMFRRHMARLHAAGCTALPLGEALAKLAESPAKPSSVVALTFDDGYAAVWEHALPQLASYGWRATIFPVSDYVGGRNDWPGQPVNVPTGRLLSWTTLRELARMGWEIGAHSRTHPDLSQLNDRALLDEITGAKSALEDRIGAPVRVFAYPYGRYDGRVQAQVRSVYCAACTTTMGIASLRSNCWALERIDMWYLSHGPLADLLASPGMEPYVTLCRVARRARAGIRRVIPSLPLHSPFQRSAPP